MNAIRENIVGRAGPPDPPKFGASGRRALPFLAMIVFGLSALTAQAHDPGLSSAKIIRGNDSIDAQVTFSPADMDESHNASNVLAVSANGKRVAPSRAVYVKEDDNNVHVDLSFPVPSDASVVLSAPVLQDLPRGHRQYVSVKNSSGIGITEKILSATSDSVPLSGGPRRGAFKQFLTMGIWHILTGYDHLLFLFGLLVISKNLRSTILTISCFTLAHSITLALATFQIVELPSRIVEPLIAATITYVGLENIFAQNCASWRGFLTFGLGLVHGLGFAGALREMGVATGGWAVVTPLLSFNLGVEIGQVGVALMVLPLLALARRREAFALHLVPVCSSMVAMAGAYWLVERTFF